MTKNKRNVNTSKTPSKKRNPKIKKDTTNMNLILTIAAVIANLLVWWTMVSVVRYSTLNKGIFIFINIAVLLMLLFMNLSLFLLVRTRRRNYLNVGAALLVACLLIGSLGTYVTGRVNRNVNKITQTGTISESVETSLVVYDENGQYSINSIAEMNGKTIGVVAGSNYETLALNKLESEKVTVTTTTYDDYITLAQGLFSGEVDIAALPGNYEAQLGINDGFEDYLVNTKAIDTFSENVKVQIEQGSDKDLTSEPFTILIMGTAEGLSDAMMLASFNPISMRVTLTSIARDSYVPIACGGTSKINSARGRSRQCAIDTVENLTGIEIDYYFESNFKGIVQMVDAIGGIVVNNPYEFVGQNSSSERGHKTVWIPAGENVPLNGEQALAFARERKLYATGDFQRQANQQQVIEAILTKVMRLRDLNKALNILDAAGENISTNMTESQLISLFNYTMAKVNRSFDQEHPEKVFDIVGSRITGYNSGLWNEDLQQNIYIYRLYDGSLKDTKDGITRNLDLNSKITAPKSMKWEATWEFYPPTLSNETYAEKVIVAEIPDKLPNYTTIGKLQAWAKSFEITVNIQYITEGMDGYDANLADGTIVWQDVATGTSASTFNVINVKVIQKGATTKCPANSTGTYPSCVCTDATQSYNKNTNTCALVSKAEHTLTVKYVVTGGAVAAPAIHTEKVQEGVAYSVASPPLEGYTPSKPTVSGTMGSADVTETITYTKKAAETVYVLKFVNFDGTVLKQESKAAGATISAPANPTREGYKFSGWSPQVASTMPANNVTYTAQFEQIVATTYTVKFVNYDGTQVGDVITGVAGTAFSPPANPSKSSDGTYKYEFIGWSPSVSGTIPTGGATYTAQYNAIAIAVESQAPVQSVLPSASVPPVQ